jgi:glyoxylate/hydroxypyruvate reductase A
VNFLFFCEGDDGQMFAALRDALQRIDGHHTIHNGHDADVSLDRSTIDAAIVWQPPADFFNDLSSLGYVFALAAGVDQLLLHPGLEPRVKIIRLEDAGMAEQMAEYVLYGTLRAQRHFHEFDVAQKHQKWNHGIAVRSAESTHIGILGSGTLGSAVAQRLVLNGYSVSCWSRTPKSLGKGIQCVHGDQALPQLLAVSDVLVCLLPLTNATRGILDRNLFDKLPRGAFVINCARGAHLVEKDLLEALDGEQLSGAMLDVFNTEPLPPDHAFWQHDRILITPHEAARSLVFESVNQVISSVEQLRSGLVPTGLVERSRGY